MNLSGMALSKISSGVMEPQTNGTVVGFFFLFLVFLQGFSSDGMLEPAVNDGAFFKKLKIQIY